MWSRSVERTVVQSRSVLRCAWCPHAMMSSPQNFRLDSTASGHGKRHPKEIHKKMSKKDTVDAAMSTFEEELTEGTRLAVYWSDDDHWYEGKVAAPPKDHRIRVAYDDGGTETIHATATKWRKLGNTSAFTQDELEAMERKKKRVQRLQVGARISVYWPLEKQFFTGTLTQIKASKDQLGFKQKVHLIRYDDGDKEWTNLYHRKIRRVPSSARRLKVGSRIFVRDVETNRSYRATVTRIRNDTSTPHRVKYDKETKGSEWLNLNAHPFREIEPMTPIKHETAAVSEQKSNVKEEAPIVLKKRKRQQETETAPTVKPKSSIEEEVPVVLKKRKREFLQDLPESKVDKSNIKAEAPIVLKKRKREFLQDLPESEIGMGKKAARVKEQTIEEPVTLQVGVGPGEVCCICSSTSPTTCCSHILCQTCIQKEAIRGNSCPHCHAPLKGIYLKCESPEDALKRQAAELVQTMLAPLLAKKESTVKDPAPLRLVSSRLLKEIESMLAHPKDEK